MRTIDLVEVYFTWHVNDRQPNTALALLQACQDLCALRIVQQEALVGG
jgi:hypothetical protein